MLKRKKDGREFASFAVKDSTGEIEAICFSNLYARVKDRIKEGSAVKVNGEYNGTHQIIVGSITRLCASNLSVTVSLPRISKWSEIMPYLKTYSQPEGIQLLVQDRNSDQLYQSPFYVSDAIYKAEWSEECYLIGNGKIDGITAPIEREYLQEAA